MEEARLIPANLIVYRRADSHYDLTGINSSFLFKENKSNLIFQFITSLYAGHRSKDATVDLDRIVKARKLIKGVSLFHDQFAGITGYLRKSKYHEDYAVYIHETSLDNQGVKWRVFQLIEKKVLSKSRLILTNSNWNREILSSHGFDAKVVYPGCNPKAKVNLEREKVVLTVSLWDKGRRPEVYAEIGKRIKGKIIMAGSWAKDEDREEFKRRHPWVHVTGALSEEELIRLYDKASVFIRFGFHEKGPGLGVLEAMGHGLPVIVNDGLGSKELIKDNGYVVNDLNEAADRINDILEDERLRKDMSLNSWEIAKSLTWRTHAEKIREHMERYFDL
ncbi:glycosyltransferase family 4 protein [Metallosphaera cuprina]|uniref:glycosyltransferase family 4 protein n=1 Tax=Metallosphaera cuprina TaxID=1006005 RepID=UPI001F365C47|nr:glycosyltransferase family 4 protein [Metallosphaera cuprina]